MRCRVFVAVPSDQVRHAPTMRIRRSKGTEHAPVWTDSKPVWDEVHIGAPKAADLVRHEPDDAPVQAA